MMKTIASGLLVLGLLCLQASEVNAAACAAGPYRAGCVVGPRGAVGVRRGYGYHGYGYRGAAVVRPGYGARCSWAPAFAFAADGLRK